MHQSKSDIASLVYDIAVNSSETAYKKLFGLLFKPLKRFALSILRCNEQAEEVACDVMIALWRNRPKLLEIDNIMVYAFVLAKNNALNVLRKNPGSKVVSIDDIGFDITFDNLTPEQILINDELKKRLEKAIQQLPPRCKMVFKLIKEDGLSYKEVAGILNISVKTVDAQLVTAVKKIAGAVKTEYNLI